MIIKIDDCKIKYQPSIEMLKTVMKKKIVRPFLSNYFFFRIWEKNRWKKIVKFSKKKEKRHPNKPILGS